MMDNDLARDEATIDEQAAEWFARRLDRREGRGRHLTDVKAEQAFAAWLQADPRHQAAYRLMERTADDITWSHPQSGYAPRSTRRSPTRLWPRFAAALACAVVLGGAGMFAASMLDDIRTDVGETRVVTLSDGTQVTLSGKSALAVHFSGRQRQVVLKYGEAYFDVVHNARRPFSVIAGGTQVRDVGTQFNVNMRKASVEISVLAGEVYVDDRARPALDAHAGQRVRVSLLTADSTAAKATTAPPRQLDVSALAPQEALAIREGRQSYDQTRLADIVDDINRYYAPGISLSDAKAGDERLTASFMPKDVGAFIAGLPQAANLVVNQSDDGHVVISSPSPGQSPKNGPV